MNFAVVQHLMWKDWYLQRWAILAGFGGGVASLAIVAFGGNAGFYFGVVLLITSLIAVGAHIAISTIVNERKEQTLTFVMSLPVSYREYTASKILGNLVIFLVPWTTMVLGGLAIVLYADKIRGLFPFVVIMAVEILVSTSAIVSVAVVTENQGWTVGAIIVGNVALNLVGYMVAHVPGIARGIQGTSVAWSPAASAILLLEFAVIALTLGLTFFLQSRKQDFL